eukprot:2476271-Heterocapsa_arctica.AAC.1
MTGPGRSTRWTQTPCRRSATTRTGRRTPATSAASGRRRFCTSSGATCETARAPGTQITAGCTPSSPTW